jgi:hypothetical protein
MGAQSPAASFAKTPKAVPVSALSSFWQEEKKIPAVKASISKRKN